MTYRLITLCILFTTPLLALAQEGTIQSFIEGLIGFLIIVVLPFLLAVGFLFFVVNAIRYFVIETDDVSKRENAKNLALYGVLAFVLILIFWGIVNLFVGFFGLGNDAQTCIPVPDYIASSGAICTGGPNLSSDVTTGPEIGGAFDAPAAPEAPPSVTMPDDESPDVPTASDMPTAPNIPPIGDTLTGPDSPPPLEEDRVIADYEAAEQGINILLNSYFTSGDLDNHFGQYADLVRESDLLRVTSDTNDEERLQVAYRLLRLNRMNENLYDDFRNSINNYRIQRNLPPIEYQYPDLPTTDMPANIRARIDSTRDDLQSALEDARGIDSLNPYSRGAAEADIQATLDNIYHPDNTAEDRFAAVDDLFFGEQSILNVNTHGAILDDFEDQMLLYETLFIE